MNTFLDLMVTLGRFLVGLWPLMFLAILFGFSKRKKGIGAVLRTSVNAMMAAWGFFALLNLIFYFLKMDTFRLIPEDVNMKYFLCAGLALLPFEFAIVLEERHKKIDAETLEDMRSLTPAQFENLVAETYRAQGNKVEVVGTTGDHGIDLVVHTRKGETWLVQCKKYRGKVGEPIIRDFYGALKASDADAGALITTGAITAQARLWAEGKPLFLYDGDEFLDVLHTVRIRRSLPLEAKRKSMESPIVNQPVMQMAQATAAATAAPVMSMPVAPAPVAPAAVMPATVISTPVYTPPTPVPVFKMPEVFKTTPEVSQTTPEVAQPATEVAQTTTLVTEEPVAVAMTATTEVSEDYPPQDKRPFMNMEEVPICPACGVPMILQTQSRLFLKPKKQYICQNAPACDEVMEIEE